VSELRAYDPRLRVLGIRHHGPGSAWALEAALDAIDPEEVLIEGPPEGDAVLGFVNADLRPPVALLVYAADAPSRSAFYPFAEFSPEWRALQWARRHRRPARFIDRPAAWRLGPPDPEPDAPEQDEAGEDDAPGEVPEIPRRKDGIAALAEAAGAPDSEDWWSALVEESGPGPDLFDAVTEAMAATREGEPDLDADMARREASMRVAIAGALARSTGPVAVVVGAWHAPAVLRPPDAQDAALAAARPKTAVNATWVPWTSPRLGMWSGYGAGVRAPGWYLHLWRSMRAQRTRALDSTRTTATWQARVAHALRGQRLSASTASVIEATRLATALAGLRARRAPGLDEQVDATVAVLCHGDPAPFSLVSQGLLVGADVGAVGEGAPHTPLEADLRRQQKRLKLEPSASAEEISLDLRSEAGLAKSTLLHRLDRLGVPWGQRLDAGKSRGTFRERWALCWEPELSVRLVEALVWGTTIDGAATSRTLDALATATDLGALAGLVEACLLADLGPAVDAAISRMQALAAQTTDVGPMLDAVPPLVAILRYGTARAIPEDALRAVVSALCGEIRAGLRLACRGLDDEGTAALRRRLAAYDAAIAMVDDPAIVDGWPAALAGVADDPLAAPALRGFALRRRHDRGLVPPDALEAAISRDLGVTVPVDQAGAWLEGFLDGGAALLLADDALLAHVDRWMMALTEEALTAALPLLRRVFSAFDLAERKRLLRQVRRGGPAPVTTASSGSPAFVRALPGLLTMLGVTPTAQEPA
jgi:hypothetical protein